MRRRSFTLVEILIVIVIVGIVATLGYPLYQNTKADAMDKVDAAHLKALKASLEIYLMEHDAVPAIITQIPLENIQNAYAKILQSKGGWKIKLASWWLGLSEKGCAYANGLSIVDDIAKGDWKLLCSADNASCSSANLSFGINGSLAGQTLAQYKALATTFIVFGHSGGYSSFTGINESARSRYGFVSIAYQYGIGITKNGGVYRYSSPPLTTDQSTICSPGA